MTTRADDATHEFIEQLNKIKCPYCNDEYRLDPEDVPWEEDNDIETECPCCDRKFFITATTSIYWSTYKAEEEEPEDE